MPRGHGPEKMKELREKAKLSPRVGKRGKDKKTVAKENARRVFEEIQLRQWEKLSELQIKRAMEDDKAREYSINQTIGKPTERLETKEEVSIKIDI